MVGGCPDSLFPALLTPIARKRGTTVQKDRHLGASKSEGACYIVDLSFLLCSQRDHIQLLLRCVIPGNFLLRASALGREQFTDAREKGKPTCSLARLAGQTMQEEQLLSEDRKAGK